MQNNNNNNNREEVLEERIRRLSHQIDLIEDELYFFRQLNIAEQQLEEAQAQGQPSPRRSPRNNTPRATTSNHQQLFPVGTEVRFSLATTEKPHLRGKRGVVVGHTPKFVRVKRDEETHLRTPIKLKKLQPASSTTANHEREERKEDVQTSVKAGARRRSNRKGKTKVSQS